MQVSITSKVLYHDRLGALVKGRVVDLPDVQAEKFLRRGYVERYETKVMRDRPFPDAGELSSASPADPVSQAQTLKPSGSGKKRGKRAASSSQTPPTE